MNGLGNEIVVVDLRGRAEAFTSTAARAIGRCGSPRFDQMIAAARNAFEPAERDAALARLHAAGVDEALFIWIAHDVGPRAMSPRIQGYVQPRSWFVDLRLPSIR